MPSIRRRNAVFIPLVCLLALAAGGCSKIAFEGADQASTLQVDPEIVADIAAPDGFRAVVVAEGLNYPSAVAFGDDGTIYVLESNTVPVPLMDLAVRRIRGGDIDELELTGPGAPTGEIGVGLTWHDGALYLSHEQEDGTFGISRVDPASGRAEPVLRGLPTRGDHDVNYLVFDPPATSTSASAPLPTRASSRRTTRSTGSGSRRSPTPATSPAATWC